MTKKKARTNILGIAVLIAILAIIAILVYPSVSRTTRKQANKESKTLVAKYQAAITRCIHRHDGRLTPCSAGKEGIPKSYSNWFSAIKAIHVYRGVIQVSTRLSLGQKIFIYYIPRQTKRRWHSSTTNPASHVSWQRTHSSVCGLSSLVYSCKNMTSS